MWRPNRTLPRLTPPGGRGAAARPGTQRKKNEMERWRWGREKDKEAQQGPQLNLLFLPSFFSFHVLSFSAWFGPSVNWRHHDVWEGQTHCSGKGYMGLVYMGN